MTSSSLDNFLRACMLACPSFLCHSHGSLATAIRQVRDGKLHCLKYIVSYSVSSKMLLFLCMLNDAIWCTEGDLKADITQLTDVENIMLECTTM